MNYFCSLGSKNEIIIFFHKKNQEKEKEKKNYLSSGGEENPQGPHFLLGFFMLQEDKQSCKLYV